MTNNLSQEPQEVLDEMWDLLYHHYTLAEFYDDLEEHPWSLANSSVALDSVIEYNGPEFENLYKEYRGWVESGESDIVKPKRPPAEFNLDDNDEEEDDDE